MSESEFDLSNPVNAHYYSKYKKVFINEHPIELYQHLELVLEHAKTGKTVVYSHAYYSCAKFIRNTTLYKFIKIQNPIYYVVCFTDDFYDCYLLSEKPKTTKQCFMFNHNHTKNSCHKGSGSKGCTESLRDSKGQTEPCGSEPSLWSVEKDSPFTLETKDMYGGRNIGHCVNECCQYMKKQNRKFSIKWIS
jgi:hypothetical protein